jgi:hypothetical protein
MVSLCHTRRGATVLHQRWTKHLFIVEEGTVVHQTFFLTTFANLKSPLIVLSTSSDGSQVRTFSSDVISLKVHCSAAPCNFKVSNSVGTCRQTTYIRFQLEEDGIRVFKNIGVVRYTTPPFSLD